MATKFTPELLGAIGILVLGILLLIGTLSLETVVGVALLVYGSMSVMARI